MQIPVKVPYSTDFNSWRVTTTGRYLKSGEHVPTLAVMLNPNSVEPRPKIKLYLFPKDHYQGIKFLVSPYENFIFCNYDVIGLGPVKNTIHIRKSRC